MLHVAFDGCDATILRTMAAAGRCPNLAALLDRSADVDTIAPYGTFVGSSWMTISTGQDVGRHGFWNWLEVDPETYTLYEPDPRRVTARTLWRQVSDAGRRVAVLDVPHMERPPESFNGVALKEWGCHDRHDGTESLPSSLLDELDAEVGRHPVGCWEHPDGRSMFAPCDYRGRAERRRSVDELGDLLEALQIGVERKRDVSLRLLRQDSWDLFTTVFGESHCVGHQCWHVHDPAHPRHDPQVRDRLGDPLEEVYVRLDAALGDLLAAVGPETTVVFQTNHGMGPHYDADHLLDEVLRRIDEGGRGTFRPGRTSGVARRIDGLVPGAARPAMRSLAGRAVAAAVRRRSRTAPPTPSTAGRPSPDRRWFQLHGNTAVGAVRFNVVGREANGLIAPADLDRAVAELSDALLQLVDVDSGLPVVRRVIRSDEVLIRQPDDRLPDLFVEWVRDRSVERVWSPLTGVVAAEYDHWRTGDHHELGMFVVAGPGVVPGRRHRPMALTEVGPTIAALIGVDLDDVDGEPRWDVIRDPTGRAEARATDAEVRRLRASVDQQEIRLAELAQIADAHRQELERLRPLLETQTQVIDGLRHRIWTNEFEREVWTAQAWLDHEPVVDDVRVSVVLPTYRRPAELADAIRSVQEQRHWNWELIVVDDGSGTAGPVVDKVGDDRVVLIEAEHGGVCRARNIALEQVRGDLVTYLDDDNRFDPGWLHAVVWAFRNHPDIDVLYGARVIDDARRVVGDGEGGMPMLQFVPFDRAGLEHANFADIGVIAHRAGLPQRFDESLVECGDWDFFLALTEHADPLALPAIAFYYRTDLADRLTGKAPGDTDRVRAKWAARAGGAIPQS